MLLAILVPLSAHADTYVVPSLDLVVSSARAVVRGEVVTVADDRVTLRVDDVLAGTAGPTVVAFLGATSLRPGDDGLFAVTAAPNGVHVGWIGHPGQGPAVVIDRHQQIVAPADLEATIRARAAWDRAHPAPPGVPPLALEPTNPVFAQPSVDSVSWVLVPPDPEFWPEVVAWSRSADVGQRERAAVALRSYPGDAADQVRARLLADPEPRVRQRASEER